jgi:hypothetical protein
MVGGSRLNSDDGHRDSFPSRAIAPIDVKLWVFQPVLYLVILGPAW